MYISCKVLDERQQTGEVLAAVLFTVGLNVSELDEFIFELNRSVYRKSSRAKKFKKKFSVYCEKASMYVEIKINANDNSIDCSIQAYRK